MNKMMRNRVIGMICVLAVALSAVSFNVEAVTEEENTVLALTLEEAQQLAIENSYAISSIERKISNTKDLLGDQKDFQDVVESTLSESSIQMTMMGLAYMPLPNITANQYVNALLIKKGYGVKGTEVQIAVLENTLLQTMEALKIGAASSYYNVLLAEKTVELNQLSYENAQEHLRMAQVKYDLGTVTKLEVLRAELSVNSAKTDLNNAQDQLEIKKLEFNNTIGIDFDSHIAFVTEIELTEKAPIDLDASILEALTNRPEPKNKKMEMELKEIEKSAVTAFYTPGLKQYKFIMEEIEEAQHNYDQSFKDIEMDVRNKYLEMVKSDRALVNMEETIALSKEALRITDLFYQYDMATLQEVTDAEVSLMKAQIGQYQMMIGNCIARMIFENAIGVGMPQY
jgi:hypothetical protein